MVDDNSYVLDTPVRSLTDIDRLIHEPSRLVICAVLMTVKRAYFLYLKRETGLTRGNLSSHLSKLEKNGYIDIKKTFEGKTPRTLCEMTLEGRKAFAAYREQIKQVAAQLPE